MCVRVCALGCVRAGVHLVVCVCVCGLSGCACMCVSTSVIVNILYVCLFAGLLLLVCVYSNCVLL